MKTDKDISKVLSDSVRIIINQYGRNTKELINLSLKYIDTPQKKIEFLDKAQIIVNRHLKPIERLAK